MYNQKDLIKLIQEVLNSKNSHIAGEDAVKLKEVINRLSSHKLSKEELLEIAFHVGKLVTEVGPDILKHFFP